jgi:hypothetical protein
MICASPSASARGLGPLHYFPQLLVQFSQVLLQSRQPNLCSLIPIRGQDRPRFFRSSSSGVTNDAVDFVRGYAASGDALSQLDSTSQTAVTRAKGHAILEQQAFPKLLAMLAGLRNYRD